MKFVTRRARSSSVPEEAELHRPVADKSKCDILEPSAMRASEFDDFDSFETEGLLTGRRERSWSWCGLIVSLAIHFARSAYFYRTRFQSSEAAFASTMQPPTIRVSSVDHGAQLDQTRIQ